MSRILSASSVQKQMSTASTPSSTQDAFPLLHCQDPLPPCGAIHDPESILGSRSPHSIVFQRKAPIAFSWPERAFLAPSEVGLSPGHLCRGQFSLWGEEDTCASFLYQ